jgi:hypothetical protein
MAISTTYQDVRFVNLTPHEINIIGDTTHTIPPSGMVARVATKSQRTGVFFGIDIFATTFGDIQDLPEPDGNYYIVSSIVANAAWKQGRTDVFCPADLVRDSEGKVVGCKGFNENPESYQ